MENKTNEGNEASGTVHQSKILKKRPWCPECNTRPCAPNYYRNGIRYWRKMCSHCIEKSKTLDFSKKEPRWKSRGYSKKQQCDVCGFRAKYSSQITVWHTDGNLNNCDLINLKSICLNCIEVVKRRNTTWKIGEIEVDL